MVDGTGNLVVALVVAVASSVDVEPEMLAGQVAVSDMPGLLVAVSKEGTAEGEGNID